jgi:hypothetical protein
VYNKVYKTMIWVDVSMTKIIKGAIKGVLSSTSAMPDIWPKTDYQKHVPTSARELSEKNWRSTGHSLRRAMKSVGEENETKVQ